MEKIVMHVRKQAQSIRFFLSVILALPLPALAGTTLDKVKREKILHCGVAGSLPGFSSVTSQGEYQGLDTDLCRAIGAAVDAKVKFKELTAQVRFTSLQTGEIDVLARNTTFTLSRDTKLSFDNAGFNFYDGQGFLIPKASKIKLLKELDGASICVQSGTTTEQNLADYFRSKNLKFKAVVFEKIEDANKAYVAGRCDAYTTDASGLAAVRSSLKDPSAHVILAELISREPLGPLVRQDDPQWTAVVRWTLNALILAEEKGITQANVDKKVSDKDPEIQRLLGTAGTLGLDLGLTPDWALKAIKASGNYGEIFERNVGSKTALGLPRGVNALWTQGGLLYSPPFN